MKKPTLEEEIQTALIMMCGDWAGEHMESRRFSEAWGYIPDGSHIPKRYAHLIMRLIEKHKGKKRI